MQADIEFWIRVIFFTSLATFWVMYRTPTKNPIRQGSFIVFAAISGILSGLYYLEQHNLTALTPAYGGAFMVLTALCLFMSASAVAYTVDLYVNVDELRNDQAYNIFGDAGLAAVTVFTVAVAFFCLLIPWYLSDPTIFEIKTTIHSLSSVQSIESAGFGDLFLVAIDQTGKAVLFDIAEVYRFGLTNLSNNPEHLTFSTVCLIYRTLVAVYVTVIAFRLIFAPK
jgi:hypothetical protein